MVQQKMTDFKIILMGEPCVGKTSFIHRITKQDGHNAPTLGVDVSCVGFHSNYGYIGFSVWDTAGDERFKGLGVAGYGVGAKGALLMYDANNPILDKWIERLREGAGEIPIVTLQKNSTDEAPFLELARRLTARDDLFFL